MGSAAEPNNPTRPGLGRGKRACSLNIYAEHLRLEKLFELQQPATKVHDEHLFIVDHQAHELWFKQMVVELDVIRELLDGEQLREAARLLHRVAAIWHLLAKHLDVLELMEPQEFLKFRDYLGTGSGFASAKFREIEFIAGLRSERYPTSQMNSAELRMLEKRAQQPSIWECFVAVLSRNGSPSLREVADDRSRFADIWLLEEALIGWDEAMGEWRHRHVQVAERQIGIKRGTGGTEGVSFLQTTTTKRLFPQLWNIRSRLGEEPSSTS